MSYKNRRQFEDDLNEMASMVSDRLRHWFEDKQYEAPEIIKDAIAYSMVPGGKRIRPVLTMQVAKAFDKDILYVEPLAQAIELIHTYSLIHDDLPAMDDATMRRGKTASHLKFGEDTAILAGDALLNMAMERALEGCPYEPSEDAQNYLLAMRVLFNNSGLNGMIGGQTADTCKQAKDTEMDNIEYIETHKTGSLLSAAILCGCVPFFGIYNENVTTLFEYSKIIGKIYQIVDDILDSTGNSIEIGKDTGLDEKNDTKSYVRVYGINEAQKEVERLKRQAYAELDKLDGNFDFFYYFTDFLCSRKK